MTALAAGDRALARARLDEACDGDRTWPLPRLELAELLLEDGTDLARARGLVFEARQLAPENPRAHRLDGALAELEGHDAVAAEAYGRSLALRDDPDVRLRQGLAWARAGKRAQAIAALEQVRAVRPRDSQARANLADLYEAAGETRKAETELLFLAEAGPGKAPLVRLARFYARTGQREKARAAEERARDADTAEKRKLRPLRPSRR